MTKEESIPIKTLHLLPIMNKVEFIGDKKLDEVVLKMLYIMA